MKIRSASDWLAFSVELADLLDRWDIVMIGWDDGSVNVFDREAHASCPPADYPLFHYTLPATDGAPKKNVTFNQEPSL